MPRGGARVGSGRKPKEPKGGAAVGTAGQAAPLVGIDGGKGGAIENGRPIDCVLSPVPPVDLPDDQCDFWRRYAGLAIEQGTLTQSTAAGFRLLCELEAEKKATKAAVDRDGRTYIKVTIDGAGQEHQELKAHPLTGSYRQLAQRVEALMGRYKLAAFGKPESGTRKKPAANPWAAIAGAKR